MHNAIKDGLENCFKDRYRFERGRHVIDMNVREFGNNIEKIKKEFDFIMLLDICGVDNSGIKWNKKKFSSVYHLLNMENHEYLRLIVSLDEQEEIPSVKDLWKNAPWFERESWDMYGINYQGSKRERLLNHHRFEGHPLCKDYHQEKNQPLDSVEDIFFLSDDETSDEDISAREWVNIGPAHPAARGTFRIMLELSGETVKRSKLEIGFVHRCFEKISEGLPYNQIIPLTNGLNHCSSPMNNIGWCKVIEELMDIDIPERAKVLRMVLAEIARITDHLLCIGNCTVDMGEHLGHLGICLEACECIYELYEKLSGARQTVSIVHIGGLRDDLPLGWISDCNDVIKKIKRSIVSIDKALTKSRAWMQRTRVCPVSSRQAIDWGYTGPCLRACGVNYDLRKVMPYYFYNDIDFEIPLGVKGDGYDRYLIRMEEMRQSIKIIEQLLGNLPHGPVKVNDIKICSPDKNDIYINKDSRAHHFELIQQGIRPPAGDVYSATEAANGELGFYVISDGSNCPYRVKVRPPCFPILQSFPEITRNWMLMDAVATVGSMNIIAGELDR